MKRDAEDVRALAKMYKDRLPNIESVAENFIRGGLGLDEFRPFIVKEIEKASPDLDTSFTEAELDRVSGAQENLARSSTPILDAVFAQMPEHHQAYESSRAIEAHRDLTRIHPGRKTVRGYLVPTGGMTRGMATNVGTSGGYLVAEDLIASSFIELLRNETVCLRLGAKTLPGLVGDVTIPKQTGSTTTYWVNEGQDLTESAPTLGQIRMTPHTVGAYVDVTRRMLLQSAVDVEQLIRADLARQIAIAIDSAALSGNAANGQPRGLLNTTGIGSVASGALSLAKIVELVQDLADANALRGQLAFAMSSDACGKAVQTQVIASTDSRMLMDEIPAAGEFARLMGHRAIISNQLSSQIVFGDWSQMVIGMWSGLDVTVDTTTLSRSGGVRIVAFMDVDVAVKYPEAFSNFEITG